MDKAATKALELIEQGAAKIGEYGPVVWAELVKYHVAMTVGEFVVALVVALIGWIVLVKVSLPTITTYHNATVEYELANRTSGAYAKRDAIQQRAVILGVVTVIFGGLSAFIGTLITLCTSVHMFATLYAPGASLLYMLLKAATTK